MYINRLNMFYEDILREFSIYKQFPQLKNLKIVVLDVETLRTMLEAPSVEKLGVACCVIYSYYSDRYYVYSDVKLEKEEVGDMILLDKTNLKYMLDTADVIVGFNILGFDLKVLSGSLGNLDYLKDKVVDFYRDILKKYSDFKNGEYCKVSLENVVTHTCGRVEKYINGLVAIKRWRQGCRAEVLQYCRNDVNLTRILFEESIRSCGRVKFFNPIALKNAKEGLQHHRIISTVIVKYPDVLQQHIPKKKPKKNKQLNFRKLLKKLLEQEIK